MLLNSLKEESVNLAVKLLSKKDAYEVPREDYRELLELVLFSFNVAIPNKTSYTFRKPGAIHKARWMAKVLYAIKLSLMSNEAEKIMDSKNPNRHLILAPNETRKLKRFTMFLLYVYVPWWFKCTSPTLAPYLDMQLIKTLFDFKQVDLVVAKSALKKLELHLWYLTEEMIPLALFDDEVPLEEKNDIAGAMLQCHIPELQMPVKRKGKGKPIFPFVSKPEFFYPA